MKIITSVRLGSGAVVAVGILVAVISLVVLDQVVGWDSTWRTFGVTPLQPPFFDMHVVNDYAACASRGVDPYAPQACNVDNFNIPRTWLWLGYFGINGSDSVWLSTLLIAFAAIVVLLLFRGRPWQYGASGLAAILSPSVLMGVERGNLDLLIFALVGSAALIYDETRVPRGCVAIALLYIGVILKLIPLFCVSLAARFSKATLWFAISILAFSSIYFVFAMDDVFLIRRNVPTTSILSYGYKAIFLGLDFVRNEAGLGPLGLADTWLPDAVVLVVLVSALSVAMSSSQRAGEFCSVDRSIAGTAFLFGAGIYTGTFLLGTNFVYRLMFLLLCVPQLQDWHIQQREGGRPQRASLYCMVLGVLWLNGNANGHSAFLLLPQLLDWSLFAYLSGVLAAGLMRTAYWPPRELTR